MSMITELFGQIPNDIETQMLIAPVLSEMIATQAFAINDQFIVNNTLYKATKAIAIGDTISVGTSASDNCVVSDSITQQMKDIDYSGTYILIGIPFIFNNGNYAIDAGGIPIPPKEVNNYNYSVSSIYIVGASSGINLTSLMDSNDALMFNSNYRTFRLTHVLNAYFSQSGATYTNIKSIRDAGSAISILLNVTKK